MSINQATGENAPLVIREDTLVIVPCSKVKVWSNNFLAGATPAKDAYISPVFKLHRRYAEALGGEWRILSAWYGFLHPDQRIEDYDAKFRNSDLHSENWWRLEGLFRQARQLPRCEQVILLGGVLYRQIMKKALSGVYLPADTMEPFAGQSLLRTIRSLKRVLPADEAVAVSPSVAPFLFCHRNHRHGLAVSLEDACPVCAENELCNLARDDADDVHCHACGHVYHRSNWY
jgi:hypothetical protein